MAEPSKLGRYELRRILGKGAMGVVYEGYDPTLDRAVAVKTILKSVVTDEETAASYSARFAREAKAAGRLSHPHIVQVYDFGEENEVAFLAMEFIQGRELRACFEARERFSMPEATRIMGELLDALDFAHQAGVIHRDVKPGNIMLDDQRRVKLADFGVARIQDGTDRSRSGAMVGTPAFMSPEQITGGKLDRRSDLFSAGVVLYQLLTNELPFKGSGAWTVAKQIMQDEPPRPSTVSTRVSPAFDAVVNRALAKKADQRYASAKEFAVALQGALTGEMAPEVRRGGDAEIEFWRTIQGSNDPAEFEVYLKEFPQGIYADLARIKISKLPRLRAIDLAQASLPPSQRSVEVVRLSEDTAKLEVELAKREAEYRKRELEAEARRLAEEKARAEAEAKREAEEQERAAAGERARLVAIESAKQEARAAVARREAELRQREAEAIEKVEAEVKARRSLEERMRREAEVRRADEARARADAEAREKRQADEAAARRAEMQQREEELTRRAAQAPRGGMPVIPAAVAFLVIIAAALGGWYWSRSSDEARLAQLTDALEAATRATQELNAARQRQEELRKQVDVARLAEDDARAKGDQTKLKELQEKTKLAEAEAQKQNELVKQREADAKKAEGAARIAEAGKQGDAAKAAQEKLAAEKLAQEKVAADKAAAEKAAAEKLAAEKAAAEKAAAEKAAVAKAAPRPAAPAGRVGWPAVGDRWVYEVRETNHPDRSFPVTVEVLAVTASDIRETVKAGDAAAMEIVHNAALAAFYSGRPGAHEVLPYLRAFQEFRAGESLARISAAQMIPGCMDGSTHCSARGKVVGREQVTVKAGTFDAWKIEIDFSFLPTRAPVVGATGIVWYSESARRFVKSEFRCRACTTQPNTDRELVSYTLGTAQAAAEKPAAKAAPARAAPGWPSAGDRWSYEAREVRRPDQKFLLDVEVLSASAAGIRETQTSQGGTVELTHRPGAQLVGVAPGIVSFAPYLRAFQELRNGDQWADVGIQNVPCAPKNSGSAVCQAMARVVGRERVSVPAGGFDAWKIAVDFKWTETFTTTVGQFSRDSREPRPFSIERTASETDQYFYWYAEDARRTVKYQSRIKTSAGSDVDMELVSYRPAEKSVAAGASSSHASALEQFKLRRGGADVVKKLPFSEQMREGQVVYVDDGSCPEGEISEATGGNPRAGLPRKLRCIKLTE